MVLGKPQAGKLAVDPREDVGDAIHVALSVRRALATPLKKKQNQEFSPTLTHKCRLNSLVWP